jgi:KDO2-lipid IV(A) lauroyltransferase
MSRREKFRFYEVRPIQYLMYLALRVIVAVVDMFPYRTLPTVAKAVGWAVRTIDRKHVRIATKNLGNSAGICAPAEIPAFIGRVYDHVGLGFAEMLKCHRLFKYHDVARYVKLVRFDILSSCAAEGRGVIIVIGHLGNWEVGGLAVTLSGFPIQSLARPLSNPWIDRYLNRFRTQAGQRVIPRDRALQTMIRVLVSGGMLVVQVDQDARDLGVPVTFFGRTASTHRAPATLSLKYNAPVVMVNTYREGLLNYAVCAEPIRPDDYRGQADPVRALTQAISDRFEGFVRQHPDQWFWMHDRWRSAERAARAAARASAPTA